MYRRHKITHMSCKKFMRKLLYSEAAMDHKVAMD